MINIVVENKGKNKYKEGVWGFETLYNPYIYAIGILETWFSLD